MDTTIGLFGVPWAIWGGVCLGMAAIYTVVRPRPALAAATRLRLWQPILRWGHAAVWLLLAASCSLRIVERTDTQYGANLLAVIVLVVYAIFLGTLVANRLDRG